MKKRTAVVSLLIGLIMPFVATAQTTTTVDVQSQIQSLLQELENLRLQLVQIQTQQASSSSSESSGSSNDAGSSSSSSGAVSVPWWCSVSAYQSLGYGSSGTQVYALQKAMGSALGSTPTGYYGSRTRAYWGQMCYGSGDSGGSACPAIAVQCPVGTYNGGVCGNDCIPTNTNTTISTSTVACPALARVCPAGTYSSNVITNGVCSVQCVSTAASSSLSITSFSGPVSLTVGQSGTWTVTASDPDMSSLTYAIQWGDESVYNQLLFISQGDTVYTSSNTFTHTYSSAGTYKIQLFARDSSGQYVTTTVSVSVFPNTTIATTTANTCPFTALGVTYPIGSTMQCSLNPSGVQGCPITGGAITTTWLCTNGQWVQEATSTTATNTSCYWNGVTYPQGSTITHSLSQANTPQSQVAAGALAMACIGVINGQYQCENGNWVQIGTTMSQCGGGTMLTAEPIIYLYPTKTEHVHVSLYFPGAISSSYPTYDPLIHGWDVTADPSGVITDASGAQYNSLFWEGVGHDYDIDQTKGFVVKGSDTAAFLKEKLGQLGLTSRETSDFIVYWLPKMENDQYNFIQFVNKEYTDAVPLTVTPSPDSLLRVFMAWKPLSQPIAVQQQSLTPFVRKGFAVVEWGGTELAQ